MAQKVNGEKRKKKNASSINKEGIVTKSWPDLPQKLINFIYHKDSTPLKNMTFYGASKSWKSERRQCNPSRSSHPPLKLSQSFTNYKYWDPKKEYPATDDIVGCSNGQVFAEREPKYSWDDPSEKYQRWDALERWSGQLPPWDPSLPFICAGCVAILSSEEEDKYHRGQYLKYTYMVLTGRSHPAFLFFKAYELQVNGWNWIRKDCKITEPHGGNFSEQHRYMKFTNVIGFKGKFYALSLQGTLAVIEVTDPRPRITAVSSSRVIPSIPFKQFRECLVETGGDILLVFLISRNGSIDDVVDNVEIYKLNFDKLSWRKVESIGERAIFVGVNCCTSFFASKIGCRSNCIYFSFHSTNDWWMYDMKTSQISLCDPSLWREDKE